MKKEVLDVRTKKRVEFIDITSRVERIVQVKGIQEGVCLVFCPHTTAGLTINENADPSVKSDITNHLEQLVPYGENYSHAEGNADSHIKTSLMGPEITLIIENSRLVLGTWQSVYLCEFDGPRTRSVFLKVIEG